MAAIFRYNARQIQAPQGQQWLVSMSDDGFFREVNEEIRQERAKAIWTRFGPLAVAVALLVVLGTGAYVGWRHWTTTQANASGDDFSKALTLANSGQADEALKALDALEQNGYGAYPVLARLRAATLLAQKGDTAGAVADFDAVSADTQIPESLRDVARIRAAYVLVDSGTYADVSKRVEALAVDTNALRNSAREALGLSAWKEGKSAEALALFQQISADDGAQQGIRQRATLMADLIRGSGVGS